MRRAWAKILDLADDVLAYVLTVAGILLSNYLPALKTLGSIDVHIDGWRIGIAALVAILVVSRQEALDPVAGDAARAGRRRNFGQRMANALAHGIAWAQVVQLAA